MLKSKLCLSDFKIAHNIDAQAELDQSARSGSTINIEEIRKSLTNLNLDSAKFHTYNHRYYNDPEQYLEAFDRYKM